jgi:alpha-L-rhamnosidase
MTNFGVYDLRCNYKKNPVGIDDPHPRLSWKIASESRAFIQTAYQIQVSADGSFTEPVLWDTGKVESDRSVHIEYAGPALSSRTRYFYRVRVWDRFGAASDWSEAAFWETAFMSNEEWQAEWITLQLPKDEQGNEPCHYLRKSFSLSGDVVSARVYATSLGLYRLYINGKAADDTLFNPGWTSYTKRLQYQTYDVTALLSEGENAIGMMLGNGWYKGYLAYACWPPKLKKTERI